MFLQVSVCPHWGGGMRGCWGGVGEGGYAWLLPGGMCGCSRGDMHGCSGGVWLLQGGAWLLLGGVHGFWRGVGHAWFFWGGGMHCFYRGCVRSIGRDTVNERAVRILLECILVNFFIMTAEFWICFLLINYCGFNTGMISCTTKSRNLDPNLS